MRLREGRVLVVAAGIVGPVAVLLRDLLPGPTLAWGALSSALRTGMASVCASVVFARRDR